MFVSSLSIALKAQSPRPSLLKKYKILQIFDAIWADSLLSQDGTFIINIKESKVL